jgi:hypothetical protein
VGNGVEGVWVTTDSGFSALAFIDGAGRYLSFDPNGILLDGSIDLSGTSWTFTPPTVRADATGGLPVLFGISGSGAVAPRQTFQGTTTGGGTLSYLYANANALAVSQADMAATWVASGASLAIDAAGALAGSVSTMTLGDCTVTGTVTLLEPGTRKNLYAVSVTLAHTPGGTCKLDTTKPYTGRGAITFANVGTAQAPLYLRSVTLLARTVDDVWLYAVLRKS